MVVNAAERFGRRYPPEPRREREQEHRKAARNLDQRDRQRIGIEARHQPSGRGVIHPGADVGDNGRGPDHRKGPITKRDPGGGVPLSAMDRVFRQD
jgi:hypothetical protein